MLRDTLGPDKTIWDAAKSWQKSWQDKGRFSARVVYNVAAILERVCCQEGKQPEETRVADLGSGSLAKLEKHKGGGYFGPKTRRAMEAFLRENELQLGDGWPQPSETPV